LNIVTALGSHYWGKHESTAGKVEMKCCQRFLDARSSTTNFKLVENWAPETFYLARILVVRWEGDDGSAIPSLHFPDVYSKQI
jgi:hypothetical protein